MQIEHIATVAVFLFIFSGIAALFVICGGVRGIEVGLDRQRREKDGILRVAVASDHRGFGIKHDIMNYLSENPKYEIVDFGPRCDSSCDYPDYARVVGNSVASGRSDFGVLVCGTGIGMSIAANKVPGVRAALVRNAVDAVNSRKHNAANVICLGENVVDWKIILDTWLAMEEHTDERHVRRVNKIRSMEL